MKIWANENAEKVVFNAILNTNNKFLIYSGNVYCLWGKSIYVLHDKTIFYISKSIENEQKDAT